MKVKICVSLLALMLLSQTTDAKLLKKLLLPQGFRVNAFLTPPIPIAQYHSINVAPTAFVHPLPPVLPPPTFLEVPPPPAFLPPPIIQAPFIFPPPVAPIPPAAPLPPLPPLPAVYGPPPTVYGEPLPW